ncbi:MAG TPA: hypothetical protein VHF27_13300 [Acidimicrobiales bacterium]|nr:hypothetical protein [Acidimicrobiales bacterium]
MRADVSVTVPLDLRLPLGVHRLVTIVGPGGGGKTPLATADAS